MLILIKTTVVKIPNIKKLIFLLVSVSKNSVLTFLQGKILIFHINTLVVLEYNIFVVEIVPLILKAAELLDIDFLVVGLLVNVHAMDFEFLGGLEGDEFLVETVFFHTDVMGHLEMGFKVVVVLVVTVLMLGAAYVTYDVLQINMELEFVIIEEVLFAEITVRMEKDNVAELIDVAALQVFVELVESVKFLLL
jgi:hypothetical protein